jgi:aspartyl-tRNA synthetase
MIEPLKGRRRTHRCGDLRPEDAGTRARLLGWAHRTRDHGGVLFLDLRDRYGITQVVFRPEALSAEMMERARMIGSEYVVLVEGTVLRRPKGSENTELKTGRIEVKGTPWRPEREPHAPFLDGSATASEDLTPPVPRPEREALEENIVFRHADAGVREHLSDHGFLEIETPMLVKPTPRKRATVGAVADPPASSSLCRSRLNSTSRSSWSRDSTATSDRALPARRRPGGGRQPEFTQIDIEMSFAIQDDVFEVVEDDRLSCDLARELKVPFPRLTYQNRWTASGRQARPSCSFEIKDVTDAAAEGAFEKFREAKPPLPTP